MTAPIGHNSLPEIEQLQLEVSEHLSSRHEWVEAGAETREQAELMNDYVGGLRALKKRVEDMRAAAVDPLKEDLKETERVFLILASKLNGNILVLDLILTDFLVEHGGNIGSATGGARTRSLRTYRSVEIENALKLFVHYRDDPEILDALTKRAAKDVRSKSVDSDGIPGIRIIEQPLIS